MVALTHWVCYLFFLRCYGPRLSVVFRRLVRLGSFLACWRQANVTPIPKGPLPSSVVNYRRISITSVMSKVFEHLVSVCLLWFMERSGEVKWSDVVAVEQNLQSISSQAGLQLLNVLVTLTLGGVLPTTQFAYRKGWVPVMHLLVPYTAECIGAWAGC